MFTVPPINALPVTPNPPLTYNDPDLVDVELIFPPTETPDPVNCIFAFSLTAVVDEA